MIRAERFLTKSPAHLDWRTVMADVEQHAARERLFFGPFSLSPSERLLTKDGKQVEIGGRSFDLLVVLTEQPGRVLSKRELLKRVWPDVVVEDGSLRFHMAGLRKLLGDGAEGARYIATQVGVGYAFVAQLERRRIPGSAPNPTRFLIEEAGWAPAQTIQNLPARLTHLIGRDAELNMLEKRVRESHIFTIAGSAGVGKTSLVIEIGHRLSAAFDGRLAFVDFAMLEDPALVPTMIAGAMGISVHSDDPLAVILGHVRHDPFLLILDNCEHVIEPAARLAERLIENAPQVRILTTSREPLRIRGENVHRLDALAYPEDPSRLTRDELLAYPAIQLFCVRAKEADSSLKIDDEATRLIAEMCVRLDGMALPVELAAVRVATHGIAATAKQLGERFSLAWPGRRTAIPRHQTLQATLDWSYDLLTDVERLVVDRLSIFVGPFSIDAVLDVIADEDVGADDVAFAFDELASKSLVTPDRSRSTGTYRLLEMTRAYAKQKLLARGMDEFNRTARRHAGFFLSELEAIAAQEDDALQDRRPLRQQLGNIRTALDWSFGRDGDHRTAVRLAAASASVFLNLSHLIECRTWCARALTEIKDDQLGTSTELELQGALGIALMFELGNSHSAGRALRRALEVATDLDDRWNQLRMLGRLHIFHERIGEYEIAMGYARRAVEIAEAIGQDEAIGIAYSLSGISHHLAGDQITARRELEVSLAKSPHSMRSRTIHYGFDHRNRSGIALARTLWLTGDADRADEIARRTVDLAAKLNHPVTHCIALIWSLAVHTWMQDFDAANAALAAFTDCAEVNALGPYIAAAAGLKGEISILQGRTEEALSLVEESLARLRSARYELLTTPFSMALARGLLLEGRNREAAELIEGSIARCEGNGELFAMPELIRMKAGIRSGQDEGREVIALLKQAITLAEKQGSLTWQIRAAVDLALIMRGIGQSGDALDLLDGLLAQVAASNQTADVLRARKLAETLRLRETTAD
jgi:predicted ATPase/DNA-binding winged helix-turn-helix (wHTH) protein